MCDCADGFSGDNCESEGIVTSSGQYIHRLYCISIIVFKVICWGSLTLLV